VVTICEVDVRQLQVASIGSPLPNVGEGWVVRGIPPGWISSRNAALGEVPRMLARPPVCARSLTSPAFWSLPTSRCAGHRGWPDSVRDDLFMPHSPTPLPRAGSGLRRSRMIRGGEGLTWNALLPRAALAGDGGHPLACPGLLYHAPSGLKAHSPCGFPLPTVSSGWGEGSRFQGV
jgi:hypothetical protein